MWTRRRCRKASPADRAGRGRVRGGRAGGTVPMCHEMSCFVTIRRSHPSPSFPKPAAKSETGPEGQFRCVMKCHEMSCFVMRPAAPPPLRKPCRSSAVPVVHVVPPSHFVPFAPPPVSGEASLFRAYRMCARARVSRRRAYRAPDCARGQTQGARLPSVPLGFFSHRCEAEGEAARGCRFLLSHPTTDIL